jgi:hypothetical protein
MSDDVGPDDSTPAPSEGQQNLADVQRSAHTDGKDGEDFQFRSTASAFGDQPGTYQRGDSPFRPVVETSVHGGQGQRVQIGHRFYYYAGHVAVSPPGPVRAEVLQTMRDRYVEVSGYWDMLAALRERRLLMLGGAPGTGRSTTALHLLDALAKGDVSRLDAAIDLRTIGDDSLEPGHGFLGELTEGSPALTGNQADWLAELLARCDCYLVFVVTPDYVRTEAFRLYGLEYLPPDTVELLDRHISAQLNPTDSEDLQDTLTELAASPKLRAALGPKSSVAETVEFAGLLVAHGRNERTLEEVEAACGGFVERQVIEWFGALPRDARREAADRVMWLAAFRIALAVLNEMPRSVVAQAGEDLAAQLIKTVYPLREPGRLLFADPDVTLLNSMRADTGDGTVWYGSRSAPVKTLCFQDNRYAQAVLSYVWQRYHNMRRPLINWLRALACHPLSYVQTCAAEAAGVLCWVDFPGTFDELIWPDSPGQSLENSSEPEIAWNYRWFAALALDQAAQDDRLRAMVEGILREWRRRGDHSARCTAAIAFGYELGHRSVDKSLDELRIIGTPQERKDQSPLDKVTLDQHEELRWAAALSIARLFATGARHPVLARLSHWIERREYPESQRQSERKSLQRLALQTVILMADVKVRLLSEHWFTGTRPERLAFPLHATDRRRWPLLLALLDDDPSLAEPIAYLLRRTLRSIARDMALEKLGSWMQVAQEDMACANVLVDLLPNLVENESDRARLLEFVHRRRLAWADALRSDIAERLVGTLGTHRGRKRGTK